MKTAFVEAFVNEVNYGWNLITVEVDENGNEHTEVTPYATEDQAEDAKELFLEG